MRELSFYFKWFFMSKKFFTYNQQLDKLEKEKGLIISDRVYAEKMVNYVANAISLRYLIPNEEFKKFKHELKREIIDVLKKCPHISEQQLYKYMGFPTNWDKITRYKK